MKKYIIFDVDGTLNRTELYAVEAYQKALEKRGRKVDRNEIIACIGMTPMAIIEKLFGELEENELTSWRADIKEYEAVLMSKKASAFEGIKNVLETLKTKGYGLAICSNAFMEHIQKVLKAIGLLQYFEVIGSLEMGADKSEILKKLIEKLETDQICMVGDRAFDIQAARSNHVPVIGCRYGYAPDEIEDADIIVEKPVEIIEAVLDLI